MANVNRCLSVSQMKTTYRVSFSDYFESLSLAVNIASVRSSSGVSSSQNVEWQQIVLYGVLNDKYIFFWFSCLTGSTSHLSWPGHSLRRLRHNDLPLPWLYWRNPRNAIKVSPQWSLSSYLLGDNRAVNGRRWVVMLDSRISSSSSSSSRKRLASTDVRAVGWNDGRTLYACRLVAQMASPSPNYTRPL